MQSVCTVCVPERDQSFPGETLEAKRDFVHSVSSGVYHEDESIGCLEDGSKVLAILIRAAYRVARRECVDGLELCWVLAATGFAVERRISIRGGEGVEGHEREN